MFRSRLKLPIIVLLAFVLQHASGKQENQLAPQLVSVTKIWDRAKHNAFTDLLYWRGKFYCAFREGLGHAGDRGKLRIVCSETGESWESAGLLESSTHDLRDAALSITPDDRLMVLGGAQIEKDGKRATGTFVSFSNDGKKYTKPKLVVDEGRWLWRVTWHDGQAFGVAYGAPDNRQQSSLLRSKDGLTYETLADRHLAQGGWPTESRIRFDENGVCYSFHRRDGKENTAMIGRSEAPYTDWKWKDLGVRVGGPNFIQLPDGRWVGVGRLYDGGQRTELFSLDLKRGKLKPLLRLPSGGDTSYPGLVWENGLLWVSYYSSHEGQTKIYLAKVRFPSLRPAIQVGLRLEPFVDRWLIESLEGVEHRLHHPQPAERVLSFDKPWEGRFCGYATVIKDEDIFRMYYRGLPKAGGDGSDVEVTCYAESKDGIRWEKPDLGIYEVDGSKANNIVLKGQTPASHNFSPFLDIRPNVTSQEKYKALGGTSRGLIAFASPDGKNWKRMRKDPVFTKGVFDSQNVAFYSLAENCYVCYFRTWTKQGYRGFRSISRTTSKNFVDWTEPVAMTFGDTPFEHLYTNQTGPYVRAPHISLGIAARFMPGRKVLSAQDAKRIDVDPKYFGDISDAVLLSTRGGNLYDRTFMESFVRPGIGLENWVSRTNYPALGIVQTKDHELSLYIQKNYGQPTSYLQRFTLRVDGFASIHAPYRGGIMTTKLLRFGNTTERAAITQTPKVLHLNAETSAAGGIRVQMIGRDGRPIPGFTFADCDEVIGDRIDHVVTWKGHSDLSRLEGLPIQIQFKMNDADLYSLQFR